MRLLSPLLLLCLLSASAPAAEWTIYTEEDGLTVDYCHAIGEDETGTIFVGHGQFPGLSMFTDDEWSSEVSVFNFSVKNILKNPYGGVWITGMPCGLYLNGYFIETGINLINDIQIDSTNTTWFASDNGCRSFNGSTWREFPVNADIGMSVVQSCARDRNGFLWFFTRDNLFVCAINTNLYSTDDMYTNAMIYDHSNSAVFGMKNCIIVDRRNVKWIGCDDGVYSYDNREWIQYTSNNSGLAAPRVTDVYEAPDGAIWFCTPGGVSRFDGVNWLTWTTANSPLPDDRVQAVYVDSRGDTWIGTHEGLARVQDITAVGDDSAPVMFTLEANYPNPFNLATTIPYTLSELRTVTLRIHDFAGQVVRELVSGRVEPGRHEVVWDGRDDAGAPVASGVYLVWLVGGGTSQVRRITLVK